MESTAPGTRRPLGVVAASLGAVVVALVLISIGVVSTTAGHGAFSGAVGIFLVLYGLFIIVAGSALWRGSLLARGPVLATGVLNLIVAVSLAGSAIQSWLLAGVAAVTVVASALPATTAWLRWRPERTRVRPSGEPPATGVPGS